MITMPKEKKLTPKQSRFVDEYMVDFNGLQAAIRAGYAESSAGQTAYRLLKNNQVKLAIEEKGQMTADQLGLTRSYLLSNLRQIMSNAARDADRLKAIELIMKARGDFVVRQEIQSHISYEINLGRVLTANASENALIEMSSEDAEYSDD